MSKKTGKKKTLLSLLSDLVDAIDRSTAENRRMRGVWERSTKVEAKSGNKKEKDKHE